MQRDPRNENSGRRIYQLGTGKEETQKRRNTPLERTEAFKKTVKLSLGGSQVEILGRESNVQISLVLG